MTPRNLLLALPLSLVLLACDKDSTPAAPAPVTNATPVETCDHIQSVYVAEGLQSRYLCESFDANTGACTSQFASMADAHADCVTRLTRRISSGKQNQVDCAMNATSTAAIRDCL